MSVQKSYFHQQLQTGNMSVADDQNTDLELGVFDSPDDYGTYSEISFGNGQRGEL